MTGVLWAFASTFGFAFYQIANRRLVQQVSAYQVTLVGLLISIGVGVILAPLLTEPNMWQRLTLMAIVWFTLSGVVHFSLGWIFMSFAQRAIGAARTSPLTTSAIILSVVLGTLFFAEPFNLTLLIGIVLTIMGVYLISQQD